VFSLAAGALSVFFACLLQQRVSSIYGLSDLKDWLSRPASDVELRIAQSLVYNYNQLQLRHASEAVKEPMSEEEPWSEIQAEVKQMVNELAWGVASFNAAFLIKVPALLLNFSVGAFLVGLGIYLGFSWSRNLDLSQSKTNSLGVLLTYIIVTALGLVLFFLPTLLKYLEGAPTQRIMEQLDRMKPQKDTSTPTIKERVRQTDRNGFAHLEPGLQSRTRRSTDEPGMLDRHQTAQTESNNTAARASATPNTNAGDTPDSSQGPSEQPVSQHSQITDPEATAQPTQNALDDGTTVHAKQTADLTTRTSLAHAQADPLVAALEASILAQEQSIASFRALLQEHHKALESRRLDT
jgi:hypothetical protein